MKKIEPIEKDKNGNVIYNLAADEANADWLRAARLARATKSGDKEAAKKSKAMENTPKYRESEK